MTEERTPSAESAPLTSEQALVALWSAALEVRCPCVDVCKSFMEKNGGQISPRNCTKGLLSAAVRIVQHVVPDEWPDEWDAEFDARLRSHFDGSGNV